MGTYPEVIRNNMERIIQGEAEFISLFLSFANREHLPERLAQVFAADGVSVDEAREACRLGWEISGRIPCRRDGERQRNIVLYQRAWHAWCAFSGRPYHLDPEINHGIPRCDYRIRYGSGNGGRAHVGESERPLRVRDQWANTADFMKWQLAGDALIFRRAAYGLMRAGMRSQLIRCKRFWKGEERCLYRFEN